MTKRKRIRKEKTALPFVMEGEQMIFDLPKDRFTFGDLSMEYTMSFGGSDSVRISEQLCTGKKTIRKPNGQFTSELKDVDGIVWKIR